MKNVRASILLFLFIMIFVYFANVSILKLCDNIENVTEDIELNVIEGKNEDAYIKSIELIDMIQNKNFITSVYISHQEVDILVTDAAKLSVYLSHNDTSEANATLHALKYNSRNMRKLQIPNLENIL